MVTFQGNKLVRDKIIERMTAKNITLNHRILTGTEYLTELRRKLIEEANEVLEAKSTEEIASELADVFEVIDTICRKTNISRAHIEDLQKKKTEERGGFEKGIYCTTFEMDANNPDIGYYRAKPNEYPEV